MLFAFVLFAFVVLQKWHQLTDAFQQLANRCSLNYYYYSNSITMADAFMYELFFCTGIIAL